MNSVLKVVAGLWLGLGVAWADPNPGQRLFEKTCASCHQESGTGLAGIYPPLVGSEWVLQPKSDALISLVLQGIEGPVRVLGETYQGEMPAHKAVLDDGQVAEILTYIRSSWGNKAGPVSRQEVAHSRQARARSRPWSQAELHKIFPPTKST